MEAADIIEPHEGRAPWVSNVVLATEDNGGIRITVDMRESNKAIQATHVPIRPDDVKAKLTGCQHFSKLDFKSAFHLLEIAPSSRNITVFHADDRLLRYR